MFYRFPKCTCELRVLFFHPNFMVLTFEILQALMRFRGKTTGKQFESIK